MRKLFVSFVALGSFVLVADPSFAGKVSISKSVSAGALKTACDKAGGLYSGPGDSHNGNYSCTGAKGSITCNKNGKCTGYCENCGKAAAPAKTDQGRIPGILTNAPVAKTQPLTTEKVTRSPKATPIRPLTQQNKTTGSAGIHPMQPLTASQSPRSRGR